MKVGLLKKYLLIIAMGAAIAVSLSSCWHRNYEMYEDDEFSNSEFSDERNTFNGEFDLDDLDR
ncbi:MAG: hypothetical protein HUK11_00760 [Muribaculaceae bacterium]|nr:hypothetical protein [Muribaculaceae bacterium]